MRHSTDHAVHDATLIAGHAAGDLVGTELLLADRLLASCEACATLHADLRAIVAATRSLPAPTAARRDFRLTPDQAERLHRGGLVRRLLRPFAGPTFRARPIAAAFSTLGAVGLAVVLLLPVLGGPTAMSGLERDAFSAVETGAPAVPQPQPVSGGAAAAPSPASEGQGRTNHDVATAAPGDAVPEKSGDSTALAAAPAGPMTLVLLGSSALLAIGLTLFALRIVARRIA